MVSKSMSHLKHFVRPGLFQLIYHATYACNAHCPFCIHRSYLNEKTSAELGLGELERIAAGLPGFPWLLLTGGEPFLRRDLGDVVKIFHKNCAVSHVTVTTNGMFPDRVRSFVETVFAECPGLTANVALSLDGPGEEHDRLRATPGNFKALRESAAALRELRAKNPRLSLKAHTVLSRANLPLLDRIADDARALGADLHTFDFVRETDGNAGVPLDALTPGEVRAALARLHEITRSYPGYGNLGLHSALVKFAAMSVLERNYDLVPEFMERKTQVIPCLAPERNMVLDPYGNVGFCEIRDWIGNLRDHGYSRDRILASDRAAELTRSIRAKECWCFHPCYQQVNVLFRPVELAAAMIEKALP
ncbi:MAG: radical SAM protein [Elusimicrobia bacterium]|nr:radical SAM protein [Elusimicrobiota bacterium]